MAKKPRNDVHFPMGGRGRRARPPKAPPRPVEITDSCGCVFCDLDDMPEMIHGVLKHHYFGHDGRLVICTRVD